MKRRSAFFAVLPLLFLLFARNGFPYLPGARYSDFAISHYPNALYLQRSLWQAHSLPWWSPRILSGAPFAANPLSSFWYPLHYLGLLFPLPFGLHLLAALHLWIGGVGMYRLLRDEGLQAQAALFGGLAFQLLPKAWAHYAAGHLTLWYALAWTPCVVLPQNPPSTTRRLEALIGFPAVLLAFLADPRWGAFAALLWLGSKVRQWRNHPIMPAVPAKRALLPLFLLLLSLPYALLLLQLAHQSTRAALTAADALSFSLPPGHLLGLLLPLAASQEFVLYPTAVVLSLALLADRRTRFWQGTAGLALAYALGSRLPFFAPLLTQLPGFNLLRVPARALFLFGMALIVLAAHGLDALLQEEFSPRQVRRTSLGLATLAFSAALFALGIRVLSEEQGILWEAVLWPAAALGVGVSLRKRWPPRATWGFLCALLLLDGGAFALRHLTFRPASDVLNEQAELATYLAAQPGRFRVYSPSYSLPQHTAAVYALELADGVDPLQLSGYAQFMAAATGVPQTAYSVTLPPFPNGDPQHDNAAYAPDACQLGLLNVRFVAAEFPIQAQGLHLVRRFGQTRVYENACVRAAAWVQPPDAAAGSQAVLLPDSAVQWQPNRLRVQAAGPGLLVLSEVAYPGWQARLDGQPVPLQTLAGVLRAVSLPAGQHEVLFEYRPRVALRRAIADLLPHP